MENAQNAPKTQTKCTEKSQNERRIVPGGYFCNEKFDEIAMCNADILRALDAITGANTSREEIYRLVARIYDQVHKSNKAISELKLIYK
jgi:aldehyde:ferredoxin oxidoreductase